MDEDMKKKKIEWKYLLDKEYLSSSIVYRACSERNPWRKVTHLHSNFRNAFFGENGSNDLSETNHSALALFNFKSELYRKRTYEFGKPKFVVIWDEKQEWAAIINGLEISIVQVDSILEIERDIEKDNTSDKKLDVSWLLANLFDIGIKHPFHLEHLELVTTNLNEFIKIGHSSDQTTVLCINGNFSDQLAEYHYELDEEIQKSLNDFESRRKKLKNIDKVKPEKVQITTYVFKRNPDVIAEALYRANGRCENDKCQGYKPFNRRSNGSPYLEVHHIKPLSEGGLDIPENTIALCPNCHREKHFG